MLSQSRSLIYGTSGPAATAAVPEDGQQDFPNYSHAHQKSVELDSQRASHNSLRASETDLKASSGFHPHSHERSETASQTNVMESQSLPAPERPASFGTLPGADIAQERMPLSGAGLIPETPAFPELKPAQDLLHQQPENVYHAGIHGMTPKVALETAGVATLSSSEDGRLHADRLVQGSSYKVAGRSEMLPIQPPEDPADSSSVDGKLLLTSQHHYENGGVFARQGGANRRGPGEARRFGHSERASSKLSDNQALDTPEAAHESLVPLATDAPVRDPGRGDRLTVHRNDPLNLDSESPTTRAVHVDHERFTMNHRGHVVEVDVVNETQEQSADLAESEYDDEVEDEDDETDEEDDDETEDREDNEEELEDEDDDVDDDDLTEEDDDEDDDNVDEEEEEDLTERSHPGLARESKAAVVTGGLSRQAGEETESLEYDDEEEYSTDEEFDDKEGAEDEDDDEEEETGDELDDQALAESAQEQALEDGKNIVSLLPWGETRHGDASQELSMNAADLSRTAHPLGDFVIQEPARSMGDHDSKSREPEQTTSLEAPPLHDPSTLSVPSTMLSANVVDLKGVSAPRGISSPSATLSAGETRDAGAKAHVDRSQQGRLTDKEREIRGSLGAGEQEAHRQGHFEGSTGLEGEFAISSTARNPGEATKGSREEQAADHNNASSFTKKLDTTGQRSADSMLASSSSLCPACSQPRDRKSHSLHSATTFVRSTQAQGGRIFISSASSLRPEVAPKRMAVHSAVLPPQKIVTTSGSHLMQSSPSEPRASSGYRDSGLVTAPQIYANKVYMTSYPKITTPAMGGITVAATPAHNGSGTTAIANSAQTTRSYPVRLESATNAHRLDPLRTKSFEVSSHAAPSLSDSHRWILASPTTGPLPPRRSSVSANLGVNPLPPHTAGVTSSVRVGMVSPASLSNQGFTGFQPVSAKQPAMVAAPLRSATRIVAGSFTGTSAEPGAVRYFSTDPAIPIIARGSTLWAAAPNILERKSPAQTGDAGLLWRQGNDARKEQSGASSVGLYDAFSGAYTSMPSTATTGAVHSGGVGPHPMVGRQMLTTPAYPSRERPPLLHPRDVEQKSSPFLGLYTQRIAPQTDEANGFLYPSWVLDNFAHEGAVLQLHRKDGSSRALASQSGLKNVPSLETASRSEAQDFGSQSHNVAAKNSQSMLQRLSFLNLCTVSGPTRPEGMLHKEMARSTRQAPPFSPDFVRPRGSPPIASACVQWNGGEAHDKMLRGLASDSPEKRPTLNDERKRKPHHRHHCHRRKRHGRWEGEPLSQGDHFSAKSDPQAAKRFTQNALAWQEQEAELRDNSAWKFSDLFGFFNKRALA